MRVISIFLNFKIRRGIKMQRNLTKGPITVNLLFFALPLMFGNLLQQLYNVADTWVVGRYLGADALAAVGSSYTLMTFLTSIILLRSTLAMNLPDPSGSSPELNPPTIIKICALAISSANVSILVLMFSTVKLLNTT